MISLELTVKDDNFMEERCCRNCGKKERCVLSAKTPPPVPEIFICKVTGKRIKYPDGFEDWCKHWSKER